MKKRNENGREEEGRVYGIQSDNVQHLSHVELNGRSELHFIGGKIIHRKAEISFVMNTSFT